MLYSGLELKIFLPFLAGHLEWEGGCLAVVIHITSLVALLTQANVLQPQWTNGPLTFRQRCRCSGNGRLWVHFEKTRGNGM